MKAAHGDVTPLKKLWGVTKTAKSHKSKKGEEEKMVKKISTIALAAMLSLPTMAMAADSDRVSDLEKKMMEMTEQFNAQMQAMQKEIADLKSKKMAPGMGMMGSTVVDWADKVSLGGQVRFRGYNIQNVWDFNDDSDGDNRDLFRLKGSLKATVKATDDVTAVIQLTDQTYGENVGTGDNNDNKIFLDNAYIDVRNMFDLPVDMTFGRQNLMYGSGFVVFDGQSQYASTSIYFDGVKLRWHATDKTSLDLFYVKDQENTTGNNANGNAGDDVTLTGGYLTSKECPVVGQSELYVLNRTDEAIGKDIWMYGVRLSDKMANGFDYSVEGALQKGDATKTVDQDAYGYKLDAGYTFKEASMAPRLYLGYAFLSGDESSSANESEQWDVFNGGWPQFGDLLAWKYLNLGSANNINNVYSTYDDYSNVTAEAVYSNFSMASIGASANLLKNLTANLSYAMLTFDEVAANADDDFGDYYQAKLKYQYNKNLSFSLYGALLSPGDAFKTTPTTPMDDATEVFWETDFRF